jgi:hypothetical protein
VDLQTRLDFLTDFAADLDIELRREPLGGQGGGLCTLRGRRVLFIDSSADAETRYEKTLAALAGLPELEARYVPPEIREDLHRRGAGSAA